MGSVIEQPPCLDRQPHLQEFVSLCELRITEAERWIENHQKLWPLAAASSPLRRLHVELERNLLESLKLLHTWRGMALHQLCGANIPRLAALSASGDGSSESPAQNRLQHLSEVIAWIDQLPITAASGVIAQQRHRATSELWEIQKRQLWA